MDGFAFLSLGLALATHSFEVPKDVSVIDTRRFAMPIYLNPLQKDKIEQLRVFVSEDKAKTWNHVKDYKSSKKQIIFAAPQDGLYWFAVQFVSKDGKRDPDDLDELLPLAKVYVNTERRPIKALKSYSELQREVEELQKTVKQLQKHIEELESNRKTIKPRE